MNETKQILLAKLSDIEGLEPTSQFPLAIGWWLIIALVIFLLLIILRLVIKNTLYKKTLKYKLLQKFSEILQDLNPQNLRKSISETNLMLKKFLITKYGRQSIARLNDKEWLEFLNDIDSSDFDWVRQGRLLTSFMYRNVTINEKELKKASRIIASAKILVSETE